MQHCKSKVTVYQSDNYGLFNLIDGNRTINKKKIERIIKEIKSGNDILDESPILVTESKNKLDIKDGQHRFIVSKEFTRPVHYIIKKKEMSLYNVAKVNSNTEKWKDQDYINCYTKAGNENYKLLAKFHKTYGIAVGTCLVLLTSGVQKNDTGLHDDLRANFEQGTFEVKKYKEAIQFAEICKSFSAFSGWNTRGFIVAITRILQAGQCDFDILLKKFNKDTSKLTKQPNWKGYINNLELIYNIDNSKRRTII
jgi:hypothetical protein